MQESVLLERDGVTHGPPPRPVGEKQFLDTTAASAPVEVSPEALANKETRPPSSDGARVAPSLSRTTKVVRASCRIRLYPSDLAEDKKAHRNGECDHERCSACQFVRTLRKVQEGYARASNAIVRRYWEEDSKFLEEYRLAHDGAVPRGSQWPFPELNSYQIARLVAPEIRPAISAMASKAVAEKWGKTRWETLVQLSRRPEFFRRDGSFGIRADAYSFEPAEGQDAYNVFLNLTPGRQDKYEGQWEFKLPVRAKDWFQRNLFSRIAGQIAFKKIKKNDGGAEDKTKNGKRRRRVTCVPRCPPPEWKRGAARVMRDQKGRWYLRISYTKLVDTAGQGVTAGINRGMRCFLAALTETGSKWIYDGNDIISHLKQIQKRRRQYQYDSKASARWGHGRQRTMRPTFILRQKGERWRQTKCQTIARRFAEWCAKEHVKTVYIEDFSGIRKGDEKLLQGGKRIWDLIQEWPYYQLQTRMVSCLEEVGIQALLVDPKYVSQTCPKCSEVDRESMDLKQHKFRCTSCGYTRHLDLVAAANVRSRGASGELKESKKDQKAARKKDREKAKGEPLAEGSPKHRNRKDRKGGRRKR